MELSLKLIMDELGYEADINLRPAQNPRFNFVELYTAIGSEVSSDNLQVCTLSEALTVPKCEDLHFLCIRDRMIDDTETPEAMYGITVIRRNIDLRVLFNKVQRIFLCMRTWVMKMDQSISANKGLQDILTLSEPILRNHIAVQNSSYKLLAYTKNIETTDVITNKLVQYGYHPPETITLFQKLRRIEEFEKSYDLVISRDHATSEYEIVKKMFHMGGSVSYMVVMVCCGRPAVDGVIELFHKFLEYIKMYVDRDNIANGGSNAVRVLALDLIMKNVSSLEEARIRAAYAGIPFEGNFRLTVLSFADEQNIPLNGLVQRIAEVFTQATVFAYNRSVLILDAERDDMEQFKLSIGKALAAVDFICGISNQFQYLWDIGVAYEQSVMAVELAMRLKLDILSEGANKHRQYFCEFSDYWIYHLLSTGINAAPVIYKNSFLLQGIEVLREYDAAHHTDTLNLLRAYLENERKATVVSSLLHMHRNTVLYHVGKIEDILGVSLDDPEVRLKLQLAFKVNNFKNGVFYPER